MTWRRALVLGLALMGGRDTGVSAPPLPAWQPLRDPDVFATDWLATWLAARSVDPDSRAFLLDFQLLEAARVSLHPGNIAVAGDSLAGVLVAEAAGPDRDYLLKIAQRESGMNRWATADRSSAAGLFQFTQSTWLCTFLLAGPSLGLERASRVYLGSDGRCRVRDKEERTHLLALRFDPVVSTRMAAVLTATNDAAFADTFGRHPNDDERYILHVFGSDDGIRFLEAALSNPDIAASSLLPNAARANPDIFYRRDGRPRSVGQVIDRLRL